MRPAAKVDEMRTERVLGENFTSALLNQLVLHPVVRVFLQSGVLGRHHAFERQVLGLQFPHARFNFLQVLGCERGFALKIVIEARVGGRTDPELGLGKQL